VIHVGTSGYSYPEWRGTFYPERFPPARMLPYYAERFRTVELNNTFYRMPTGKTIAGWDQDTPVGFVFALKVPQRITHFARLRDVADPLRYFLDTALGLGAKLGPLLLQLPPNFRKDTDRLDACLALVPPSTRVAVEFRHASWLDDEVRPEHGALRRGHRGEHDAGRRDGRLRLPAPPGSRLRAGRARALGGDVSARRVARRLRLLQARGVGDRPGAGARARGSRGACRSQTLRGPGALVFFL
jgi:uncharacterized protein YecE (DUF72 family)